VASPDNSQFQPSPTGAESPQAVQDESLVSIEGIRQASVSTTSDRPIWSGWDVLLIAALTFVVMFVLQVATAKATQLLWYPRLTFFQAAQKMEQRPILLIVSQFLFYVPVALLMIAMVEGKYHVPFWRAIRWNWPRSAGKFLALGAVLLLGLATLESLLPMPKDTPFDRLFDRPLDAYLLALIAVTLAPLMEELFFRGLMYPVLARHLGILWGVLLSALPFALLHLPQYGYAWAVGLVIFAVGVVCGVVRAMSQSVAASFLVHAGYNATQMLIQIVLTHGFTRMPKSLLKCF